MDSFFFHTKLQLTSAVITQKSTGKFFVVASLWYVCTRVAFTMITMLLVCLSASEFNKDSLFALLSWFSLLLCYIFAPCVTYKLKLNVQLLKSISSVWNIFSVFLNIFVENISKFNCRLYLLIKLVINS